jgi:uncharacterized membrane protein
MIAITERSLQPAPETIEIRRIGAADLGWALRRGWDDFREKRGDIIVIAIIYPIVGLFTAALAVQGKLLPLIFPLFAGLSLMGPAMAAGFYELAKRREQGEDAHWRHFLDAYRGATLAAILPVTTFLALLFMAWLGAAWLLYVASFGPNIASAPDGFIAMMLGTAAGWRVILTGNLVGLGFAAVVLATSVVSLPMLVDRRGDPMAAVILSVRACWHNAGTMAVWGLIVAALLAIGTMAMLVGLAVVLPVLGYATWHLYTRIIPSSRDGRPSS